MTGKQDYEAEITQALKQKPRNGIALQEDLHIPKGKIYEVLLSMENKGLIHWVQTKAFDGEWEVNNGSNSNQPARS